MNKQLDKLQEWLVKEELDMAFINEPNTIAYLSGYESDPHERILALAVFATEEPFLFTPELEKGDALKSEWPHAVYGYLDNEDPWSLIAHHLKSRKSDLNRIAIEKDFLTVGRFEKLQSYFSAVSFLDITPKIQAMKLIKTPEEIDKMMEAGKWADRAFEIGFNAIKEGISEEEIVAEIEYHLKKEGIKEMSFETMVLTGDNAASPHGTPGKRQVQLNEFVLFDLGVIYNGYTSDATRTIAFGEPSKQAKEIYAIVLEAYHAALSAVKPGITAGELDRLARDVITKAGYGPYFTHRLGHGLGSSVHEFPSIMQDSDFVIQEGMCFSIEPGIYLPGVAGVRIEDCVVVTKDGCKVFTHTPNIYTSI